MTEIIKPAATILLARDKNDALEVLLLKRNKALIFAGGLWVFPGGKIELDEIRESENELAAAKRAAIRETLEEAQITVTSDQLTFFRHWTTPAIAPRRYGTWFFFAGISNANSTVITDDEEIKGYRWINPKEALEQVAESKMAMMPPTLLSLKMIQDCECVADIQTIMDQETPQYILPVSDQDELTMMCFSSHEVGFSSGATASKATDKYLTIDISSGLFKYQVASNINLDNRIHSLAEVDL